METHPDSAYTILTEADSLISRQPKKARMLHLLLKTDAANKLYLPLPSDTLFSEVVNYYDNYGTPNQRLKAHYLLGCIYRDMEEAPQATQCYYDAVEKADTLSNDCDYTTLFSVYGQMAELFRAQYLSEEELKAEEKYCFYALKANDTYNYICGLEQTIIPYFSMRNTAQVLQITEQCHQLYEENGMPQAAARVYPTAILLLLENSQYKDAHKFMTVFESESGLFDEQGNIQTGKEHYYYSKGLYCMGIHQIDSAEYYYRKLLSFGHEYDAYKGLLSVYQAKEIPDSIVKYSTLCEKGLERLFSENQIQSVIQLSSLYDYTRNQKIAIQKTQEAEHERNIRWFAIVMSILIAALGFWRYRKYKRNKITEIRNLGTEYTDAMTRLSMANKELLALKESYSNLKENLLQTKQDEIKMLNGKIQEYQALYQNMKTHEKESSVFDSDIVKKFKEMATFKREHNSPKDTDWEKLIILLKQCLPLFYTNTVEHHMLTGQELYTCLLTFLRFSNSEMAILLNTSPQRITNVKMHLNKKLFREENATSLYSNLKSVGRLILE